MRGDQKIQRRVYSQAGASEAPRFTGSFARCDDCDCGDDSRHSGNDSRSYNAHL